MNLKGFAEGLDDLILDAQVLKNYKSGKFDLAIKELHESILSDALREEQHFPYILGLLHSYNASFDSARFYLTQYASLPTTLTDENYRVDSQIELSLSFLRIDSLAAAERYMKLVEESVSNRTGESYKAKAVFFREILSLAKTSRLSVPKMIQALEIVDDRYFFKINLYIEAIDVLIESRDLGKAEILIQEVEMLRSKRYPNNPQIRAEIALVTGYFYYSSQQYLKSIDTYENQMLPILDENNSRWSEFLRGKYLRLSGLSYSATRENYFALKRYQDFLALAPRFFHKSHSRVGETYKRLSEIYLVLGKRDLSLECQERYIEIASTINVDFFQRVSEFVRGDLAALRQDWKKAIYHFRKVMKFKTEKYFEYYYKADSYFQTAVSHLRLAENDSAYTAINTAIDIFKNQMNYSENRLIRSYLILFDACMELEQRSEAITILYHIINHIDEAPSQQLSTLQVFYLGEAYTRLDRLGKREDFDLEKLERIARLFKVKFEKSNNDNLLHNLARAYNAKSIYHYGIYELNGKPSDLKAAFHSAYEAVNLIKSSRKTFRSQKNIADYNKQQFYALTNFVKVAVKYSEQFQDESILEDVFYVNELFKASALTDKHQRSFAASKVKVSDSLTLKVNSLREQSSYLSTQINRITSKKSLLAADSVKMADFRTILLENKIAYDGLMLYLEKHYPSYYNINYNPQIATTQAVRNKLKENEALLEYFVGDDGVYVFTIARDTAQVFRLDAVGTGRIKRFQNMIQPEYFMANQGSAYQEYIDEAYELYNDLMKEPLICLNGMGIDKLYIVPDKQLNYLPFELLITERPASVRTNYKGLKYLLKDFAVSYGYSASILFRNSPMSNNRPYTGSLLAVAPSYGKILGDTAELTKLGKFRDSFAELKYNKDEADGVQTYFNGEVLKGDEATEAAFAEKFQNYDILHLAMHALVDNDDSDKSRLVFTPQKDSIYDSYLHNFELYNFNMNPKMAVLSACNTGFGSLETGEGVMSLARAFTYAGAESVVMSHWRVDDQASSTIMQSFYKYLAAGKQKDEALRLAKLDYLETAPATAQHPFHWNNFVVLGDVSSLEVPFVWYKAWWVYLLIAVVILSTILVTKSISVRPRQT